MNETTFILTLEYLVGINTGAETLILQMTE